MPGMTPDEIALLLTLQFAIAFLGFVIAAGFRLQLSEKHMQISSDPDANDDWPDLYSPMPELPSLRQRWTVRRKAAVVEGVRGGWIPIEEACRLYNISVDEFLAWERDLDRNGVPGLRSTRYQIYRDTDLPRS
jgi:Protein of unknown function (DUF1153)